ncbi:hypothetical protein [Labrys miyagiensis]
MTADSGPKMPTLRLKIFAFVWLTELVRAGEMKNGTGIPNLPPSSHENPHFLTPV